MISEQQAEIARAKTGSTADTNQINREVNSVIISRAEVIFIKIETILKEHNLPFEQAFPTILTEFKTLAENECLDPASVFCLYMDSKF